MLLRPVSHRYLVLGLLVFLNISYGANFTAITPVIPLIMEHFDITRGTASLLVSVVIIMQALFIIPGGMLVARAPIKLIYGLGWIAAGAMVLSPLVDSFAYLVGLRAVYGLAFVVMMPAMAPILMRSFARRQLAIVNVFTLTAFTMGMGLGIFLGAPLANWIGWQDAMSLLGGVLLIGLPVWWLLARVPSVSPGTVKPITYRDMWRSMRSRTTLLLGLGDAVVFSQFLALTTWLPTFYNETMGMSLSKAGFIVGIIPMVGILGALCGGLLSARLGLRRPFFIGSGALVGMAGFGSFAVQNEALIIISVVVLGLATFAYFPVLITVPMDLKGSTEGSVAVTWATMFAIANSLAVAAPISVGYMTDSLGSYIPAFSLWAVLAFGLLVVGLMLPETGPRRNLAPQPGMD